MTDSTPHERLIAMSLPERQKEIKAGRLKFSDAAADSIEQISTHSDLNAFLRTMPELTARLANEADNRLREDAMAPLAGVLLAVKDNISLKGDALTCASKILEGYISPYTATALQRLIDAGATIVGKTNLDEFAMGSSTEHSAYGTTLNPFDKSRVPGGSSGGSAAAVAAGLCTAALGSETGGSVRQPAAFCGVVGLKPTYGRISRYGLVAFGSSLDQIGVMARSADECARVFQIMAGHDPLDNTTSPAAVPDCVGNIAGDLKGLKVGLPIEYIGSSHGRIHAVSSHYIGHSGSSSKPLGTENIQPEIRDAVQKAAKMLEALGATVTECDMPHTKYAIPVYYILAPAEASSNLARYDGVRFGLRGEAGEDIIRASRQAGFGAEVKRRIMLGTYVLSSGYYDAYYLKAQRVRRLIRKDFINLFNDPNPPKRFDLLLTPTTPTTAFKIGEKSSDPIAMYLSDIFTAPANLAGIPAISVPFGQDDNGLPIGIQLMAGDFREDLLLRVAHQIQIQTQRSQRSQITQYDLP